MIVRMWKGVTRDGMDETYESVFVKTGLRDYQKTPGNRGVMLLKRATDEGTEYLALTIWDSVEAVKAFAGDECEKARYYQEDGEIFSVFSPTVDHFDVVLSTLNLDSKLS